MKTLKLVIALVAALCCHPASADERFLPYIDWIVANSDYQYNGEPLPEVQYHSPAMLLVLGYGEETVAQAEYRNSYLPPILGLYNHDDNVMMLPKGNEVGDFEIAHIVVHELVHYLQDINDFDDKGCIQNREPEAYRLHEQWMDEHDHPADRPDGLFVLMLAMACSEYRDMR